MPHIVETALIEAVTPCHDAHKVPVGFEPCSSEYSDYKVGGLQHSAAIP